SAALYAISFKLSSRPECRVLCGTQWRDPGTTAVYQSSLSPSRPLPLHPPHAIFNTVLPEWRNWQTQQTQNLPGITPRVGSTPSSGTILFPHRTWYFPPLDARPLRPSEFTGTRY